MARRGTAGAGIRLCVRSATALPAQGFDLANRIAVVGAAEGWCADYARAAYRRWFLDHEEAGSERSNAQCLGEIGQDPRRVLERAASQDTAAAYEAATAQARGLGIFGVPTFATRGEIFWGDDRLESAIRWHQSG